MFDERPFESIENDLGEDIEESDEDNAPRKVFDFKREFYKQELS